jgi:pimeloyl-ACP methyl ester carboxylesterase
MRHTISIKAVMAASLLIAAVVATACQPAPVPGRNPVIIVAGTFSPSFANEILANRLRADGYDTTIFELPTLGAQDISLTAQALCSEIDVVQAKTGATKVDLVGHSQGGLVARDCVKNYGGNTKVDTLVMLGAPNYGTVLTNLLAALTFGTCLGHTACLQMAIDSPYLNALNAGPDVIAPVKYVSIYSAIDELVIPPSNAALKDEPPTSVAGQCRSGPSASTSSMRRCTRGRDALAGDRHELLRLLTFEALRLLLEFTPTTGTTATLGTRNSGVHTTARARFGLPSSGGSCRFAPMSDAADSTKGGAEDAPPDAAPLPDGSYDVFVIDADQDPKDERTVVIEVTCSTRTQGCLRWVACERTSAGSRSHRTVGRNRGAGRRRTPVAEPPLRSGSVPRCAQARFPAALRLGFPLRSGLGRSGESNLEVGDDVVDALEAHREAHQAGLDTRRALLLVVELTVGGRRRVDHQGANVAQVGQLIVQLECVGERLAGGAAALDDEAGYRPGACGRTAACSARRLASPRGHPLHLIVGIETRRPPGR